MKIRLILGTALIGVLDPAFTAPRMEVQHIDGLVLLQSLKPLTDIKKGEFEKTPDFNKRVCDATNRALNVPADRVVTIAAPLNSEYDIADRYSADKEMFIFHIKGGIMGSSKESFEDQWKWKNFDPFTANRYLSNAPIAHLYREAPVKYTGKTVHGISKEVRVASEERLGLFYSARAYEIKLAMKASEAQKLKGDLRVIFSARLSSPCFFWGTKHTSPKVDNPYDRTITAYGLVASSIEWIVVRAKTMEIVKRGVLK